MERNTKISLSLLQILLKVLCYLTEKMYTGITTADTMIAVGVGELTEILVGLHQRLGIFCHIAEMHVIIS